VGSEIRRKTNFVPTPQGCKAKLFHVGFPNIKNHIICLDMDYFIKSLLISILLFLTVSTIVMKFGENLGYTGLGLIVLTFIIIIGILLFGITTGILKGVTRNDNKLNHNINFGFAILVIASFLILLYKLFGFFIHN
jgi:hypothetical protein